TDSQGRKAASTHRLAGRARDNRLVQFAPGTTDALRPGDLVEVEVTYAAPHYLVADSPVLAVRPTLAGDAWEARTSPRAPTVSLGMPGRGVPAAAPAQPCG